MELVRKIADIVLHLDRYLGAIISQYGLWTYSILFVVIFIETGLVIMPFLPGDSLLFAAGTFAAAGSLDARVLVVVLAAAAVIGDTVNYWIGRRLGQRAFSKDGARFFKKEYLDRTHAFYEKHGGKTIIIARFVPIIRTFAPFVAGIGRMSYGRFLSFNVLGGAGWVLLLVGAGYFFGAIPFVRKNFSVAILAIILISALPIAVEYLRNRRRKRAAIPKP
ncbi:MAG: DedA family protein [Acidobacteriota bacterium]